MAQVQTHTSAAAPVQMIHAQFDELVQHLIDKVAKEQIQELKQDFHNRLRLTLTQPDSNDVIEHLWDFFYDWCVFEETLPEKLSTLEEAISEIWVSAKDGNIRGLFQVQKIADNTLKLKDLYSGKTHVILKNERGSFVGIQKGDIIEGRLLGPEKENKKDYFRFARRPSYHPPEVHAYIKSKVKKFKKSKDFPTYQSWLWLLVGMYVKHRLYAHMPVDKIYDDNSRI